MYFWVLYNTQKIYKYGVTAVARGVCDMTRRFRGLALVQRENSSENAVVRKTIRIGTYREVMKTIG